MSNIGAGPLLSANFRPEKFWPTGVFSYKTTYATNQLSFFDFLFFTSVILNKFAPTLPRFANAAFKCSSNGPNC